MSQTRAEWQSERDERNRRTGEWGFDPGMPWHIANWRERAGIVFFLRLHVVRCRSWDFHWRDARPWSSSGWHHAPQH